MPPTAADRTLGEIARRLDDVVSRFEALANRLDTTYVRREVFEGYKALAEAEHKRLGDSVDTLSKRVGELEEGRKWLSRVVLTFVILAVLGAVFTVGKT